MVQRRLKKRMQRHDSLRPRPKVDGPSVPKENVEMVELAANHLQKDISKCYGRINGIM